MTTIGFTGARVGCTPAQKMELYRLIQGFVCQFGGSNTTGLHGDCVGADAEFHEICRKPSMDGMKVECRPCTYNDLRAKTDATEIAPPVPPMERNRMIVADADIMVAIPPNFEEIKRGSGTWATIGFTRRANKPLYIIFPDGSVSKERVPG